MNMLEKTYTPSGTEEKHYKKWEVAGIFEPSMDSTKEPYAIMMPPPNVTGTLHVGHVLDNTLPDMLVRRARMMGHDAIYQPGTDHASIAVHVVLDRQFKEEGVTRFELGREEFLKRAWKWKEHSAGTITNQMRRIGVSCAWEKERFTMDEGCSKAVQKVFIDLHERGLIYRGQRLVNWDPSMQTAVSDLEVKHKEVNGHIWHFKYPYTDGFTYDDKRTGQKDGIVIATTRPETILADGAIAINPEDPRAKDLVGKYVTVPLVNRDIPIIADPYPDPEFGSGMVKITAAHDFNDFEVYERNKGEWDIPLINLLTKDAKMNENCPADYIGLDRFDARKKVIKDFKELGLFIKEDPHTNAVGHAERDDTVLEPYLTDQWFIKAKPLADKCIKAAKEGKVNFLNKRDEKNYYHWLENIQDWCISRQLWWGHRIPAYYSDEGEIYVGENPPEGWTQDDDILDTWFSSALWPFSTLGWPEDTDMLERFYPGHAIMPGPDILFFWIIRMMMMGLEFTGKPPFKNIYTHAIIRDGEGQKMSKSKGNVVDPMGMIDEYGADALRHMLVSQSALGQDIRLAEKQVEGSRNFCTKLWNASRYAEMNGVTLNDGLDTTTLTHPVNQWIIGELATVTEKLDSAFESFRFNEVGSLLYHFTWDTFCDWYLELTKPLMNSDDATLATETKQTMGFVLENILRLMSPVMPFITEEIWQNLAERQEGEFLMTQNWPQAKNWKVDTSAKDEINWLINMVSAIRTVRTESRVPPKAEIAAFIRSATPEDTEKFAKHLPFFTFLCKIVSFEKRKEEANQTDVVAVAEGIEVILPLEGVVDFAAEKERLAKEIEKKRQELDKVQGMLNNKNFVDRAPEDVVSAQKELASELAQDLSRLESVQASR
jgi:valyl-tRNA synthetase